MATAASVPITTAISEEMIATLMVIHKLSSMTGSEKSLPYQSNVKPDHFAMVFAELNEKIISMRMGAYKNSSMIAR